MPVGDNPIHTILAFNAVAVVKSTSSYSEVIDVKSLANSGNFSVEWTTVGTGTGKIEYLICSTIDGTFIEPSGASDIKASMAAGHDGIAFTPVLAPYMKLKISETAGSSNITAFTVYLNIQ